MEGNAERKDLNAWFHSKDMNWHMLFQKLWNLIKKWKWLSRLELLESDTVFSTAYFDFVSVKLSWVKLYFLPIKLMWKLEISCVSMIKQSLSLN